MKMSPLCPMVSLLHTIKNYKNSPDHAIIELDGLLAGAGEIPSVDLEKRAPMRFVVVIMFYMKITSSRGFQRQYVIISS